MQSGEIYCNVRKRTMWNVRPAKTQIRLRIRAVWSESSLGALNTVNDPKVFFSGGQRRLIRMRGCESSLGAHVRNRPKEYFLTLLPI